jgi:hypothetical protein
MVMNLSVPENAGKFLNSYITGRFLRRLQLHEVTLINPNPVSSY